MQLEAAGKKSKSYVYQKIILVFVVLLVPLISMNIALNYKGMSMTKASILQSSEAGASFYAKQLDRELILIRGLQLELLGDKNLQKLGFRGRTLGDYETVSLIDQVRDRLTSFVVASSYIVNAGVYVEAIGKSISTVGGVTAAPNEEVTLFQSLIGHTPKPSFYRSGSRMFLLEQSGGIGSYIELSRPKLLEALAEIASLFPQSEVSLGSEELGTLLSTSEEAGYSVSSFSRVRQLDESDGYYLIRNEINSLQLSLLMYANQDEITRPLRQFSSWFYALFVMAAAAMGLYAFSVHRMIHRPLSKLVKAFRMIESGSLGIRIASKSRDEFHYVFNGFNRMADTLRQSIEENYGQRMALQHAELKQLQSQINPHFLYNGFFNIYMMSKVGDAEGAAELSQKLGSYYQYITRNGSDEVPFAQEYRHALDYCEIQGIRFSNRIFCEFELSPDIPLSIAVPRLIVQPVVENAFEHAFEDGTEDGAVYIDADYCQGRLRVTVEDNGKLLTEEAMESLRAKLANDAACQEQTGLMNVNKRLRLKYAPGSGLFVSRSAHGGLRVDLIMIVKEEEA
ncbi:sensor histidine kinase [Paenibacillus methanolicus]|uniref:Two-component system sensor histidine kinase YesM n=1 Tax=Paenibacillus methanolicus TaxID=582686 RepID=A0A5S5CJM4_9BACL|nr:histidine kinase [Paenibacillus methanolicus]TYP78955.1 two-component system sensor histidine kinase YesM [Paenibacillus methanolicus]